MGRLKFHPARCPAATDTLRMVTCIAGWTKAVGLALSDNRDFEKGARSTTPTEPGYQRALEAADVQF